MNVMYILQLLCNPLLLVFVHMGVYGELTRYLFLLALATDMLTGMRVCMLMIIGLRPNQHDL